MLSNSTWTRSEKAYVALATAFTLTFVLSNVLAAKLFRVPWSDDLALPSGIITYPLTFLLTDIVTEVWGAKRASNVVWLAFAMNLVMLLIVQAILLLPPHSVWGDAGAAFGYHSAEQYQQAFEAVFSLNGKLLLGSLVAYLLAQLVDVHLFAFLKRLTKGRHLWLRNNVSTMISQIIDTVVVSSVYLFWAFHLDLWTGIGIMLSSYTFKLLFALCDTPIMYLARWGLRHYLKAELKTA